MKPGDTVRVCVDVDTYGDAMDADVPYTVRDAIRGMAYVERVDGAWFGNEYEWCVSVADVREWKLFTARGVA